MAFENISKGEFEYKDGFITTENNIIALIYNFKDQKQNAEFIAYCFNLQQRYDISKLEEAVKLFELLLEENMCSIAADGNINNLLNHIKK